MDGGDSSVTTVTKVSYLVSSNIAIKLLHIGKIFEDHPRKEVFKDVNLTIREGEFVVAEGPVGSGKTTLIKLMAGLERPTYGSISIQGVEIADLREDQLASLRASKLGVVYQTQNLFSELTVSENLELALSLSGVKKKERKERVKTVMNRLGIDSDSERKVSLLSVGERQMVAIARALVNDPPILLMDEPTEALDPLMTELIIGLVRADNIMRRKTIFATTHNNDFIQMADRVIKVRKRIS